MSEKEMKIIMECLRYNAIISAPTNKLLGATKDFYDIQDERVRELYGSPREDIKKR